MNRTLTAIALVLVALSPSPAMAHDDVVIENFPQPAPEVRFSDDFGSARAGHSHKGNDLLGFKMQPVVAVASGAVTRIDSGGTAGNWIVISHQGDWESWYMHLNNDTPGTDDGAIGADEFAAEGIEVGAFVEAGQRIAWVGDSGNAEWTTAHTHFEIHHHGEIVNPYPYLLEIRQRELLINERNQGPLSGELLGSNEDTVEHCLGELSCKRVLLGWVETGQQR